MSAPDAANRVLVVDDDEDSRDLMASALEVAGYSAFAVGHAEAAVERLAVDVPHAIITDLTLPEMSGEELAKYVRSQQQLEKVLLIATSGRDVDAATVSLFDFVQPKPIDFQLLLVRMASAFQLRAS